MRKGKSPGQTLAMEAVAEHAIFGFWQVLRLGSNNFKVIVQCINCLTEYERAISDLTRKDRPSMQCQKCNNKTKTGSFQRLPRGEALINVLYGDYIQRAGKAKLQFEVSRETFDIVVRLNCFYCDRPPFRERRSPWDSIYLNGIDRKDNKIGYVNNNIVPCCKDCNYMKHIMSIDEFLTQISRIANHHNLEI